MGGFTIFSSNEFYVLLRVLNIFKKITTPREVDISILVRNIECSTVLRKFCFGLKYTVRLEVNVFFLEGRNAVTKTLRPVGRKPSTRSKNSILLSALPISATII